MSKGIILLSIVMASMSMSGCASKEHSQRVSNIINHALSEDNKITSTHISCFKCQTGNWPQSVVELKSFSPTNSSCKSAFQLSNLSEADHITEAVISIKQSEDKVSVLFSRTGISFDNFSSKDSFVAKNFNSSELECSHNK